MGNIDSQDNQNVPNIMADIKGKQLEPVQNKQIQMEANQIQGQGLRYQPQMVTQSPNSQLRHQQIQQQQVPVSEYQVFKIQNTNNYCVGKTVNDFNIDYEFRCSFQHPHLMKTYGFKPQENILYFEYQEQNLKSMIMGRKKNQLFPEGDILALAKGISSALAYLQERDIVHGDICTENIFFSQSTGGFKIYDQEIYASKFSGFELTRSQQKQALMPPELIVASQDPYLVHVNENFFKADIYSLGLVLLEAMTLSPATEIYDPLTRYIVAPLVQKKLQFACKYYSPEICHIVRIMLEIDPNVRSDCQQVWGLMSQQEFWQFKVLSMQNEAQKYNQIYAMKQTQILQEDMQKLRRPQPNQYQISSSVNYANQAGKDQNTFTQKYEDQIKQQRKNNDQKYVQNQEAFNQFQVNQNWEEQQQLQQYYQDKHQFQKNNQDLKQNQYLSAQKQQYVEKIINDSKQIKEQKMEQLQVNQVVADKYASPFAIQKESNDSDSQQQQIQTQSFNQIPQVQIQNQNQQIQKVISQQERAKTIEEILSRNQPIQQNIQQQQQMQQLQVQQTQKQLQQPQQMQQQMVQQQPQHLVQQQPLMNQQKSLQQSPQQLQIQQQLVQQNLKQQQFQQQYQQQQQHTQPQVPQQQPVQYSQPQQIQQIQSQNSQKSTLPQQQEIPQQEVQNLLIQEQIQQRKVNQQNIIEKVENILKKSQIQDQQEEKPVDIKQTQQKNFKITIEKIKQELESTKKLMENYHSKAEQLKKE